MGEDVNGTRIGKAQRKGHCVQNTYKKRLEELKERARLGGKRLLFKRPAWSVFQAARGGAVLGMTVSYACPFDGVFVSEGGG